MTMTATQRMVLPYLERAYEQHTGDWSVTMGRVFQALEADGLVPAVSDQDEEDQDDDVANVVYGWAFHMAFADLGYIPLDEWEGFTE